MRCLEQQHVDVRGRGLDAIPLGLGTCPLALPSVGTLSRQAEGENPAAGILKRERKGCQEHPSLPAPKFCGSCLFESCRAVAVGTALALFTFRRVTLPFPDPPVDAGPRSPGRWTSSSRCKTQAHGEQEYSWTHPKASSVPGTGAVCSRLAGTATLLQA